ncbi:AbiH family protein [Acinetobacter piscicola]|uniref:AbiH family protein n=1 Tax=Acinetobacter piscicola TaxID=2006115 RepID=UPI000B8017E9|nr:AbiH family protein [Acinetobacter piscicola]
MNILIVGNGFDLSHYLPTKYDHFMDVMKAIEEKQTGGKINDLSIHTVDEWIFELDKMFEKRKEHNEPNYQMNFDELFSRTRDPNFIEKTKEFYLTEQIQLSAKDVLKLQYRLELNCWYQYFKKHVNDVKTWIDFEQKIENALTLAFKVIKKIHLKFEKYGKIDTTVRNLTKTTSDKEDEKIYISELDIDLLIKLGLFKLNNDYGKVANSDFGSIADSRKGFINDNWFYVKGKTEYGFSSEKYISYLNGQLDEFIEIFNQYLELIVSQLESKNQFKIDADDWIFPKIIYSFNYTNTYKKVYQHKKAEIEFLHGSHGDKQNIVLGISDIEDNSLKNLKAYGFTKYHQKLFKDTDYLFLDNFIKESKIRHENYDIKKDLPDSEFQPSNGFSSTAKKDALSKLRSELNPEMNISIWGHSLDVSDKDYIKDLFSLNDDIDRNVRVVIYFFDKNAKFALLNNLLAILGKNKVEDWMKSKWLKFKENPKIVMENAITLEDLPKM